MKELENSRINDYVSLTNADYIPAHQSCSRISFKNEHLDLLELMYIKHFDMLCLYGRQFSEEDPLFVQDCIQDLFMYLYTAKCNFLNTDSIKFYLMKSLRRLIVNKKKALNRYKNISVDCIAISTLLEEYNIENKIITAEKRAHEKMILQDFILQLPKRQQEAIFLKFYSSLKFEEIAEKMNLNTKSVYKIIYKALKSLRKMFDNQDFAIPITAMDNSMRSRPLKCTILPYDS